MHVHFMENHELMRNFEFIGWYSCSFFIVVVNKSLIKNFKSFSFLANCVVCFFGVFFLLLLIFDLWINIPSRISCIFYYYIFCFSFSCCAHLLLLFVDIHQGVILLFMVCMMNDKRIVNTSVHSKRRCCVFHGNWWHFGNRLQVKSHTLVET